MRGNPIVVLAAIAAALVVSSAAAIAATTTTTPSFTVPGTADPWLAGMPDGSTASFDGNSSDQDDTAPAQSPTEVPGLNLTDGGVLKFTVDGSVHYAPQPSGNPPDGDANYITNHYNDNPTRLDPENGISDINAPVNSLIGVFLGPEQPDDPSLPAPPSGLDFATQTSRDYCAVEPKLRQVFFIGDGLTSSGQGQSINIPDGATRLFLGSMDGVGWWNNYGSFSVQVAHTPPSATDGLVAYYPFSGHAKDASGNGHDGTLEGGADTFPTDVPPSGGCSSLSFDGSDDAVSVPDDPALDFGASDPMTISLWAKKSASPDAYHILGKRQDCYLMNYQLARDSSNGFHFNSQTPSTAEVKTSVDDLPLDEWMHLAVTYDTSTLSIYANGQLVGSKSPYVLGTPHDGPLKIGASGTCGAKFPGLLDEVRIYNRALSATEIGSLANKQTPSDTTKPTITLNSPTEGASYKLGGRVIADYGCSDDTSSGSDLSCEGTLANGSALDTSSVGPKTFTVTSTDKAGNTQTKTVNYGVVYDFAGFYQPVDNLPTLNKTKPGKVIPVRFSLKGDQGTSIFASGYPKAQDVPCTSTAPVDGVEETTTGKSGLTYDSVSDRYTYNWATDSTWGGTCKQLVMKLADGTFQRANFDFRKP